ncbi:MAG: ThuA domain-containing protein [Bryobacteraceae bacterium]|nr:ThuA domain-containing protein [Bryobacteraceae bacterium]
MYSLPFLALALAGAAFAAQSPAGPPQKIRTLLITGGNLAGHDWRTVSPLLRKALEDTGRFDVRVTEDFRGGGAETLAGYDLVVLNYYDARSPELQWSDRSKTALLEFVKSGKGLVLYHFSAAAFDGWTEYEKLSGGNWRPGNGHHSPQHDFTVELVDREHPITKGLRAKFRQFHDELYANLRWQPAGTFKVLAHAWDDHKLYTNPNDKQPRPGDGMHQPMLWVLPYGEGRVFATALGHDGPAVKTAAFTATFTRGAEWAATGAVTLPVPDRLAEGRRPESTEPPVVTPDPLPSDAVRLSEWTRRDGSPTGCTVDGGELVCRTGSGDAVSKEKFRSAQIHLEFLIPDMPNQKGQLKGNSGVYLQGLTEIQVLDSYRNPTYATGTLGAVYDQYPPLVNAAKKPGEWSTYDIVYRAPVCSARGAELRPAAVTVFVNGVLVQDHAELRFRPGMCEPGPLLLQDHSGFPGAPDTTMKFRNLWIRRLD